MKKAAVVPILIATVFWGFIGFFSTTIKNAGLSTPQTLSARMTFAALALIVATLFANPKKGFKLKSFKDLLLLFACGTVTLTINNIFYFTSIERSGMSVAAVLMYTAPIFVMIMSAFIYKEKITPIKVIALIVTFVGCALVSISSSKNTADPIGIICGLISGMTYAMYSIFANTLLKRYTSLTVVMYTYIFAALSSYFVVSPFETFPIMYSTGMTIYAMLFGIFCSAAAHGLYSLGMKYTEPSIASILASLELVMASIVGFIAFGQSLAWYNYIGIALVMAAVVMLNIKPSHKEEKKA
jgi:drug/metabolite transporter (DMT)-like permease